MKLATSIIIFFLAILALVAEFVLYMIMGMGSAFSGDMSALEGTAFFFVSLMILTAVTGVLAPVSALVELVVKKENIGLYIMLSVLGFVAIGLVVFATSERMQNKQALQSSDDSTGLSNDENGKIIGSDEGEKPMQGWRLSESTSVMDDSKAVALSLRAEEKIFVEGARFTPVLMIRCKENTTSTYIILRNIGGHNDDNQVRVRFGIRPPVRQVWSASTDRSALFSPSPISIAKELQLVERFLFEYTPPNSSPKIVSFDVRGLDQHLEELAGACGWGKEKEAKRIARRNQEAARREAHRNKWAIHIDINAVKNISLVTTIDEVNEDSFFLSKDQGKHIDANTSVRMLLLSPYWPSELTLRLNGKLWEPEWVPPATESGDYTLTITLNNTAD